MSAKLDLYKKHSAEYVTPKKPVLLDVGAAQYLAIEGKGEPGGSVFTESVGALYNVAFTIKMTKKFAGEDYAVSKLEGLWWEDEPGTALKDPRKWNWKLMIRTPDFIRKSDLSAATKALLAKGKPARVADVQLEKIKEGKCVQVLHVGPYTEEAKTIALMHDIAAEAGYTPSGKHHEIYLSDPRRVVPERLRTILRQPVSSSS